MRPPFSSSLASEPAPLWPPARARSDLTSSPPPRTPCPPLAVNKLSEAKDDIEFDESIPQRTSEKKGLGKKARKEQVRPLALPPARRSHERLTVWLPRRQAQDKARGKLESLALNTTTVGFWTFFSAGSRVDK